MQARSVRLSSGRSDRTISWRQDLFGQTVRVPGISSPEGRSDRTNSWRQELSGQRAAYPVGPIGSGVPIFSAR